MIVYNKPENSKKCPDCGRSVETFHDFISMECQDCGKKHDSRIIRDIMLGKCPKCGSKNVIEKWGGVIGITPHHH